MRVWNWIFGSAMCLFVAPLCAQTFLPGGPLVVRDSQNHLIGQMVDVNHVSVSINGHDVVPTVVEI